VGLFELRCFLVSVAEYKVYGSVGTELRRTGDNITKEDVCVKRLVAKFGGHGGSSRPCLQSVDCFLISQRLLVSTILFT